MANTLYTQSARGLLVDQRDRVNRGGSTHVQMHLLSLIVFATFGLAGLIHCGTAEAWRGYYVGRPYHYGTRVAYYGGYFAPGGVVVSIGF